MSYQHWYLYILECEDGSLYTGITKDLDKRIKAHKAGKGSRYVRSRLPITLAAWWKFNTSKGGILKLEQCIKSLPSCKKWELVKKPDLLKDYCQCLSNDTALLGRK
ncbi:MAG: GIY-YIG nuclease family protein [Firmicutes bacterium]|nr:GIY-YIG nuclease family protein [Bacillota bacterium]